MKNAYLIIAHNEPYILEKLIDMLDYENNDLYIHIDKKCKSIDTSKLKTSNAHMIFIDRMNVSWGGLSQIKVELELMKESSKVYHDYYHLISGVDLPLMNNKDINNFLEKNYGKNFLGVNVGWGSEQRQMDRHTKHWFFQEKIGKNKKIIWFISRCLTKLEMIMHYNRKSYDNYEYYGGSTWFSLTHDTIKYILSNEEWITKKFKNTVCCDEIFIHTLICNSKYKSSIYNYDSMVANEMNLRYLNFEGSSPKILDIDDYDLLVNSNKLFARKFSTSTTSQLELVDKIFNKFK